MKNKEKKANILVVDDEDIIRKGLEKILSFNGYCVRTAANSRETFKILKNFQPEVIILDLKLGNENGLKMIPQLKKICPDTIIIMLTAYGTIETAIEAIKKGAYDFLTKPYHTEELLFLLDKILREKKKSFLSTKELKEKKEKFSLKRFIAISPSMKQIKKIVEEVAKKNIDNILLLGESGVGKDYTAQVIHYNSPRCNYPFIAINICSLSASLIESELFGYKKGAFTGAEKDYPGLITLGENGTLFLDEIGELPLEIQVKLLRIIENKEYKSLGESKFSPVKAHFMYATNKNLKQAIENGTFRKDLFYRINTITIEIPPLRKRREDIIPLAKELLKELNFTFKTHYTTFSPRLEKYLLTYDWPGNVRELKNFLERILLFSDKNREMLDLVDPIFFKKDIKLDLETFKNKTLEEIEKEVILQRLEMFNYNLSQTAKSLGIGRGALRYKIKKWGIDRYAKKN